MGMWSIGFLRGQYQPEDFSDAQSADMKVIVLPGSIATLQFSGWHAREATITFIVDALCDPLGGIVDPEIIFQRLVDDCRPPGAIFPNQVDVSIPKWPGGKAFIEKVSIKRTHIDETGRALRATISVTITEAAGTDISGGGGGGGIGLTSGGKSTGSVGRGGSIGGSVGASIGGTVPTL